MSSNRISVSVVVASVVAIASIANSERFIPKPYMPTPQDVPTIGYGSTVNPDTGKKIRMTDPPINEAIAKRWLVKDIGMFEREMRKCVKVPVTQSEWDAYTSLTYNIGALGFCRSTLVKKLNAMDYKGACAQILRWDRQKGKVLRGLTNRRKTEYKMCTG